MMTMFPKMIVAMAALLLVVPAHAQSFSNRLKDVAERAVKSEVERKVDNEVRKATRCVLGDDRCIQEAQRRGEQVEIVQVGSPQPVSSGGYTQATSAAGARTGTGNVATDAAAMAAGLDRHGTVTLGGLNFDTARATLRPESGNTLDQVELLLHRQPQLRVLIVGHTDSTGSATANQTLSRQRAESVRNALVARGIPPSRLTFAGAGSNAPVADNSTEWGRTQNRRVELVRQ